jgi:hypothetical protein
MHAVLSEQTAPVGDVCDFNEESVPSPGFWLRAVRHCLPATAPATWCTEDKPQLAAIQHCESGSGVHYLVKVQLAAIERDRGFDIVHDVTDAHTGHHVSLIALTGIVDLGCGTGWQPYVCSL